MLPSLTKKIHVQGNKPEPLSFPDSNYNKKNSNYHKERAFRIHGARGTQKISFPRRT